MTLTLLVVGFSLLILGAEALVKGASRIANLMGIPPLIIGLTIVAFGTSAPELVVSILASMDGNQDISLGNVIGSNIFNILFILGTSALITPLVVSRQLIKLDVPIMIICSFAVLIISINGEIKHIDGYLLIGGLIIYLFILFFKSRKDKNNSSDEFNREYGRHLKTPYIADWAKYIFLLLFGLALLILGSRWVVEGARNIALYFGVSELVIGLTIVAVGTSLPELATSLVASMKGERDIAVGNIVGSNIFNILGVLGFAAVFAPEAISVSESIIRFDIPVMIAVSVACLPIFFTGNLIARWEGGLFLAFYISYIAHILLSRTIGGYLSTSYYAVLFFVAPITTVTIFVILIRIIRNNKKS